MWSDCQFCCRVLTANTPINAWGQCVWCYLGRKNPRDTNDPRPSDIVIGDLPDGRGVVSGPYALVKLAIRKDRACRL